MNFKNSDSYREFSRAKITTRRYHHNEVDKSFFEALLATSKKREMMLKKGTIFWRAQLGEGFLEKPIIINGEEVDKEKKRSHRPKERMKPLRKFATDGRANPKGIPYLYLSTKEKTAITELRPWVGSRISIGQFRLNKDLRIINCAVFPYKSHFQNKNWLNLTQEERNEWFVWTDIENAFFEPISQSDKALDYIPTQCIAEFFKSQRFDGIAYKSSTKSGYNVALFDLNVADLINCGLKHVTSVEVKFELSDEEFNFTDYDS